MRLKKKASLERTSSVAAAAGSKRREVERAIIWALFFAIQMMRDRASRRLGNGSCPDVRECL
jgi:hypothetical protein